MDEIGEKLDALLNDPKQFGKIAQLASSILGDGGGLQQLLQKFSLADLESEDLLLILVLYLMYRESGDKELLFILGGMLFL